MTQRPHTIKQIKSFYSLISGDNRIGKGFRTKATGLQTIIHALSTKTLSVENARQLIAEINELPIISTQSKKTGMDEEQYTEFLESIVDYLRPTSFQKTDVIEEILSSIQLGPHNN